MNTRRSTYRYQVGRWENVADRIIAEAAVALTVNGQAWLTFLCTPQDLEALALGFLYNEGVIQSMDEVADVRPCEHNDNVDVWLKHEADQPQHWKRTSGCSGGASAAVLPSDLRLEPGDWKLTPEQVSHLIGLLFKRQEHYRESGGLHASALSDGENILVSVEDIGRHNTLDKLAGKCLQGNLWPERRAILTTGRVSSEMLQKSARLGAAILVTRTAPTALAVELADQLGMTLIGYARGERFTVYAHHERLREIP